MKASNKKRSGFIAVVIVSILFIGCNSAKYSTEYRRQKKNTDSLTIFNPIVTIISDNGTIAYPDSARIQSIQSLIEKVSLQLLNSKYIIETKQIPKIDQKTFDQITTQLEDSPKEIDSIRCDSLLKQIAPNCSFENRFALLITYNGIFNPTYSPHYNTSAGLATNSIIIAPFTKPHSNLRLLIIDTEAKEIAYFDQIETSNYDPRIPSEVEKITRTILKNIYYK